MTLPPYVNKDCTPLFETIQTTNKKCLFNILNDHFEKVKSVAKERKSFYEIKENTLFNYFYLEKENALEYLNDKEKNAKLILDKIKSEYDEKILIEVSAQHPLDKDNTPNEELKKRLDTAIKIYKNNTNVKIYVPESIHNPDIISLSEAGKKYLLDNGVNAADIFSNEANKYYKTNVVYNSADECYVASKLFFDNKFTRLICVCSLFRAYKKYYFIMNLEYCQNMKL